MMARMKLGQIVATRGVVGLMRENNDFAAFVHRAFQRYLRADWGELCESDRKQNDRALAHSRGLYPSDPPGVENLDHYRVGRQRHHTAVSRRVLGGVYYEHISPA